MSNKSNKIIFIILFLIYSNTQINKNCLKKNNFNTNK